VEEKFPFVTDSLKALRSRLSKENSIMNPFTRNPDQGDDPIRNIRRFPILPIVVAVLVALVVISSALGGFKQIDGSESGVYVLNGKTNGQRGPGWNWKVPFFSDIAIYTVRRIQVEAVGIDKASGERAEQALARSGAEHVELASDAKARGGQIIDQAPFRLWYHVPPALFQVDEECQTVLDEEGAPVIERQNNLEYLYNNLGKTDELVQSSAVMGPARNIVKNILLQFEPEQLIGFVDPSDPDGDTVLQFGDINGEINRRVTKSLCLEMHAQGVILEDFSIGKLDFNDRFELKIAETQEAAQNVEIERNNVAAAEQRALAAEKDGEGIAKKKTAEATGSAAAIIAEADANAHATEVQGVAQARAHQLDVEAVGGPEKYVQIQIAREIGQWRPQNLIGGEGSGVIPILNLNEEGAGPDVIPIPAETSEGEESPSP